MKKNIFIIFCLSIFVAIVLTVCIKDNAFAYTCSGDEGNCPKSTNNCRVCDSDVNGNCVYIDHYLTLKQALFTTLEKNAVCNLLKGLQQICDQCKGNGCQTQGIDETTNSPPPVCGDEINGGSACVNGQLQSLVNQYCSAGSDQILQPQQPVCGNNIVEPGETCDGAINCPSPSTCQNCAICQPPNCDAICGNQYTIRTPKIPGQNCNNSPGIDSTEVENVCCCGNPINCNNACKDQNGNPTLLGMPKMQGGCMPPSIPSEINNKCCCSTPIVVPSQGVGISNESPCGSKGAGLCAGSCPGIKSCTLSSFGSCSCQ